MSTAPASLYVHIPFCSHKCEYCAFYSHAPSNQVVDRFVKALTAEMRMVPEFKPRTIFFGGGTPSLLSLKQWGVVLEEMGRLGWLNPVEWTVECNPATVSADKAKLLRDHGVTRISMGVQSMSEPLLERLGRIHSREQVFKSYDILRAAGFGNINLDLMFGIPGQTMEIWEESIREIAAMGPDHLSCYEVTYEDDTPLFAQLKAGEFSVDEELVCDMFERLVRVAGELGYAQYEISNFATVGADGVQRRCLHNVNYWKGGFYHALGPSASGHVPVPGRRLGLRTKNWSNTTLYCEQVEAGRRPVDLLDPLEDLARAGEIAAFGLRMNEGWDLAHFREVTGFDLDVEWGADIDRLVRQGSARLADGRFHLTPEGLRFADLAGECFVRPARRGAATPAERPVPA